MNIDNIDGSLWSELLIAASTYLVEKKQIVDALNVFPVPDGDTGTNMSLTMVSAAKAVMNSGEKTLGEITKDMAYGALMGARGNSGVILSQLLAGFAKSTEEKNKINAQEFGQALCSAVDTAYRAVMNPVEGTILTVAREASQSAMKELEKCDSTTINTVFMAAYQGAFEALQKTPQMLPVLKQAGVVDAGGQGLVYIFEAMLATLNGEQPKYTTQTFSASNEEKKKIEYSSEEVLSFQYCTEFILKKKKEALSLENIKDFLVDKGDCLLVVGNSETSKIHIHTNYPGKVLDYCTDLGSLHEVQIHNMSEQSEEMKTKAKATKHLGIITVSCGSGLNDVFRSLGVDVVITGGQTMNPSTQDFIEAIDEIMTEEVLILPNNGNVILAAQQAVGVAAKPTRVVQTKTIPQGIAALMAFNAENDLELNKSKMEEAGKQVITLEITYAVRDAQFEGHNIKKGQILGIGDGKLITKSSQIEEVVESLFTQFLLPEHELITVYYGEDIQEGEAEKMIQALSQKYPQIDFELHYGGQPLYYYLLSIE